MRITHAQPLRRMADDWLLDASPLLTRTEAEAEAFALEDEGACYMLDELDGEHEPLGHLAGEGFYTHLLTVIVADAHVPREWLVRVAEDATIEGAADAR